MALVVDTTKKYRNIPDGQNFTFSLSKPFNELTVDDLLSAECWVGFNACSINQISEGAFLGGIPENNPNYCNLWCTDADWWFDQTNWTTVHWSYPANFPDGVYMRNVYVNRALNAGSYTIANTTARLVLEITPDANTSIQKLCMIDNSNYLHAEYNTSSYGSQMSDYTYISPAMLIVVNNVAFLVDQNVQRFFVPNNIGFYIDSATAQGYQTQLPSFINSNYHKLAFGWTMGSTSGSIEDNCVKSGTNSAPVYTYSNVNFNGHTGTFKLSGGGTNYHKRLAFSMADNADDSDFSLIHRAYSGVRFKVNDTWYKPIIEGGLVTGYTDDMTVLSEWDTWTKASGHNVPVGPPSPTPSEDDSYANMGIGVGTGVGGYTTFAIMSRDDLLDLLADFNANLETGMSVVNNFICLYKLGPLASYLCSTRVGNIIMSANAETNFVSVREDYHIVTAQKDIITLGSYNVPRMTNTFYDFAPYSTYELFIPCCGWVPLPDTVAGRTIDVYMIIDLSSCTCKGVCRIGGTTVAEASGVLGVSVPFFSTDSGLKRAADVMAVTQMISGLAQGAVGAGVGAGALVVSGSANALQGLEQLYINGNTNYTAIKGGNGDITAVGNGEYCTVKITHPKVDEVVNNSRFGHSVGYICNTVGKIKNFKGLTVCANPHVTGIECTVSEKEEIKRLLEEGIIVN